jgi:hypothetical protein
MSKPTNREIDAAELMKMDLAVGKAIGLNVYIGPNMANKDRCWIRHPVSPKPFHPTESDADAMAVLKKVAERIEVICFWDMDRGAWLVQQAHVLENPGTVHAPTLNLAICKFALKLFQ